MITTPMIREEKAELNHKELSLMANSLRFLSIDAVEKAKSGHPGMPMGMADVAAVLWGHFLRFNPDDSKWMNRDRFVLSAGHGSALLYALLHLSGYPDMTIEEIKKFRQMGSKTAGHPEYGHAQGIETTTGPLGQGFANAVGFALAENLSRKEWGPSLINHKTYVIASDGDLMEGISHEAASFAGHLKLNHLIVLFDDNGISIDGPTNLSVSDDQLARFKSYGWETISIDGHNYDEIYGALSQAQHSEKPIFIACKTKIGFGSPNKEGKSSAHGSPLGEEEIQKVREKLNWSAAPFEIPAEVYELWGKTKERNQSSYTKWQEIYKTFDLGKKHEIERRLQKKFPQELHKIFDDLKETVFNDQPKQATRQLSQNVLEAIKPVLPELLGGSADLTPSNNTRTKVSHDISAKDGGDYIRYGVREHAMAAIMNGLSLYGGFIPYGGTFLVFSDYLRPSLRLSALMKQQVIYVLTHDSIGLGEDGPTHQPVEHVSSLRAIPNLLTFRPADGVEVAECWQIALNEKDRPSVLALSRQNVPTIRQKALTENLSEKGAYILKPCPSPMAVIVATGTEVHLAIQAAEELSQAHGIPCQVVSMPCWRLFDEQSESYKQEIFPRDLSKIAIEAGIDQGWHKYIGNDGLFIGVNDFGQSGPYQEVYKYFGLTQEAIISSIKKYLGK